MQRSILLMLMLSSIAILVALGVMALHYLQKFSELEQRNTSSIAEQVVRAVVEPLQREDRRALLEAARGAMLNQGVVEAQIRSADGEILAYAGSQSGQNQTGRQVVIPVTASGTSAVLGEVMLKSDDAMLKQLREGLLWNCQLLFGGCVLTLGLLGWGITRYARPALSPRERSDEAAFGRYCVSGGEIDGGSTTLSSQEVELQAAESLEQLRHELQAELHRATQELELKNSELHRASLAKSKMLAAASHDLRQPLHALNFFTDALQSGESDPERLVRVGRVKECVDSLDRLFTELLDLAQLDAGVLKPSMQYFALDQLFDELSRNFRSMAEERQLRLVVRKTDLFVCTDYVMLARMLSNLVSNAIRYTAQGGILIAARRYQDRVRIDVIDTGIGIAQEHQAQVFEEFFRVVGTQASVQRGAGLGLATVQRLAHLLEIDLSLHSRIGRGTRLSLLLDGRTNTCKDAELCLVPVRPQLETHACIDGKLIWVIDDEPVILEGLELVLSQMGASVVTAAGSAEALQRAWRTATVPDVVVCDLLLANGESGLELIRQLQAAPHWSKQTPGYLLVTGETSTNRLMDIDSSMIAVLHKPVSPAVLRQQIFQLIQKKRDATCSN